MNAQPLQRPSHSQPNQSEPSAPLNRNQIRGFWASWGGWTLDGMDSVIYALVLVPSLRELLPRSGIAATKGNIGYYGGLLFALFLIGWGLAFLWGPHKIYYGNSGAEAIEGALKLARYHTKRQQVIAFFGAFHGRTMGALSLTASKPQQKRRFSPLVPGVTHVRYPDVYRGCVDGPQDAEKFALGCARYIEDKLFKTILAPEAVAAIIVEPNQAEGGYVVAPTIFMQELRRICDKHGILLVLDEVQSGMGRTGKWFAVEHTGVHPDIVCMAKGIASGMPLGVTMSKADIMDWIPGSHASTFGGNPVCIAAALATLDVIEKEGLLRNSQQVGDHMLTRMGNWPKKYKIVGDVRGRGLMIGVEIVKDQATREYGASERDRIVEQSFERGILFLGCGPSTIRIAPPLIVTKDEADVAMDALEESIASVAAEKSA